jgi:hypothetical protein
MDKTWKRSCFHVLHICFMQWTFFSESTGGNNVTFYSCVACCQKGIVGFWQWHSGCHKTSSCCKEVGLNAGTMIRLLHKVIIIRHANAWNLHGIINCLLAWHWCRESCRCSLWVKSLANNSLLMPVAEAC